MARKYSDSIAEVSWKDADVPDGCKVQVSGILVTRVNIDVDAPNNLFGFQLDKTLEIEYTTSKKLIGERVVFKLEHKERRMLAGSGGYTLPPEMFDTKKSPDMKKEFIYAISVTLLDDQGQTVGRNIYAIKEAKKNIKSSRTINGIIGDGKTSAKVKIQSNKASFVSYTAKQRGAFTANPGATSLRRRIDASFDAACSIYNVAWAYKKTSYKTDTNGRVKELLPPQDEPSKKALWGNSVTTMANENTLQLKSNNFVYLEDYPRQKIQLPENVKHLADTKAGIAIFGTYPNKKLTMLDVVADNVSNKNQYGNIKDPDELAEYMKEQANKLEATAMTYRIIAGALQIEAKDRDNGKDK